MPAKIKTNAASAAASSQELQPYVIRNKDSAAERWSNEFGWVEDGYDRFSEDERRSLRLPLGGEWEDAGRIRCVHKHLLDQAKEYAGRDRQPVTAWDQIAAKSMSKVCKEMAAKVEGMSDEEALAWLLSFRDSAGLADPKDSTAFVMSLSYLGDLDRIIDPISRENCGWIEVSEYAMTLRPHYRRMVGINQCTGAIVRETSESDEQWAKRRRDWLLQYHPEVKVRHSRQRWTPEGMEEIQLGSAKEFAAMEHTHECALDATHSFRLGDGVEYDVVQVFKAPKDGGSLRRFGKGLVRRSPLASSTYSATRWWYCRQKANSNRSALARCRSAKELDDRRTRAIGHTCKTTRVN